jgi:hypothetical protein
MKPSNSACVIRSKSRGRGQPSFPKTRRMAGILDPRTNSRVTQPPRTRHPRPRHPPHRSGDSGTHGARATPEAQCDSETRVTPRVRSLKLTHSRSQSLRPDAYPRITAVVNQATGGVGWPSAPRGRWWCRLRRRTLANSPALIAPCHRSWHEPGEIRDVAEPVGTSGGAEGGRGDRPGGHRCSIGIGSADRSRAISPRAQATHVARSMTERHREPLHLFICSWCGLFHVGHDRSRRLRLVRRLRGLSPSRRRIAPASAI